MFLPRGRLNALDRLFRGLVGVAATGGSGIFATLRWEILLYEEFDGLGGRL